MVALLEHRTKIDARASALEPVVGLDIVADLLKLDRDAAKRWVVAHGDPTETPAAAVLLAHEAKVNADTILATCVDMQRTRETFSIALLAHNMMSLLLTAILLFRQDGKTTH